MTGLVETCLFCKNSDGTDKILYRSRKVALQEALLIKFKQKKEIYVYPCPRRIGWHLTSKYNNNHEIYNKYYYVFIDGYNLAENDIDVIINEIKMDGNIVGVKQYGKYNENEKEIIKNKNIEVVDVDFFVDQLDVVFVNIIMDAIQLATNDESINSICLVSLNNTFNILANKLTDLGFHVLGFGFMQNEGNSSFTKYINIDELKLDIQTFSDNLLKYLDMIKYGLEHTLTNDEGWIKYNDFTSTIRKVFPLDADRICGLSILRKLINGHKDKFLIRDINNNVFLKLRKLAIDYGFINNCSDSYGFIHNNKGIFYFASSAFLPGYLSPKMMKRNVKFKIYKYPDMEKENTNERNGRAGEVELID